MADHGCFIAESSSECTYEGAVTPNQISLAPTYGDNRFSTCEHMICSVVVELIEWCYR